MATTARRIRVDLVRKFILSYVSGAQCIRRTHVRLYFPRAAIRCPKCGIKGATARARDPSACWDGYYFSSWWPLPPPVSEPLFSTRFQRPSREEVVGYFPHWDFLASV